MCDNFVRYGIMGSTRLPTSTNALPTIDTSNRKHPEARRPLLRYTPSRKHLTSLTHIIMTYCNYDTTSQSHAMGDHFSLGRLNTSEHNLQT